MELKVMSWNIHHGTDEENRFTLREMASFLEEVAPDILCLNEVDAYNPRSGFRHQARFLARKLGYDFAFGPALSWGPARYGNAILTRGSLRRTENIPLPSEKEQRALLKTRISLAKGISVNFFSTHLGLSIAERRRQVKAIVSRVLREEGPVLLAGDFNAGEDELKPLLGILQDALVAVHPEACTYPAREPCYRLDYILCSSHFEITGAAIPGVIFSDHLPVTASLKPVW